MIAMGNTPHMFSTEVLARLTTPKPHRRGVYKVMTPPPESIRNCLSYDPLTGAFTWLVDVGSRGHAGDKAGFLHADSGYYRIKYLRRTYAANRLAWWMMTGEWPALDVDHKNLNRADDRWENLRLANSTQNQVNAAPRGPFLKGVTMHGKRFRAQINVSGKKFHLGCFSTEQEAHDAFIRASAGIHGEFVRSA